MFHPVTLKRGSTWLIHDAAPPVPIEDWLFDAEELAARGMIAGCSQGRRSAWFFHHAGMPLILRHYWRGGMVARLTADVHGWQGLRRTRPYRELEMLHALCAADLPAPRPVACRLIRRGLFYRGDIITVTIADSHTFAQHIMDGGLTREDWQAVGRTIRRFHDHGAHHSDLNVRNILLDTQRRVWLIDWDQGRLRGTRGSWRQDSMDRLRRSLSRESTLEQAALRHWDALSAAYRSG
ncbi:MAG: 3-deoxy-D-manno-octulosonic acid kinase [Aquisalimonadaceae bacterium]